MEYGTATSPNAPTLSQKQRLFTQLVAKLIEFVYTSGYEATLGEAFRTPEQAALNAAAGTGIANSLHTRRLAIDLNLWKDNKYLTDTESYKPFGDWWKQQNALCCWGGDFLKADGNHFSLTDQGYK